MRKRIGLHDSESSSRFIVLAKSTINDKTLEKNGVSNSSYAVM